MRLHYMHRPLARKPEKQVQATKTVLASLMVFNPKIISQLLRMIEKLT